MKKTVVFNIIQLLIIFSYLIWNSCLLVSDNLQLLFHPRNYPFFLAALFFLLMMFYRQICNIISGKNNYRINISVLIFLLPVLAYAASVTRKWDIQGIIRSQNSIVSVPVPLKKDTSDLAADENLVLTDDNYFNLYNEISGNLDKLTGKKIEVSGYVFREEHYDKTEIVIARDLMWCCAADVAVIGFYCNIEQTEKFSENSWIQVEGYLEKHLYHNNDSDKDYYIPSIKVESAETIDPPEYGYIYPF